MKFNNALVIFIITILFSQSAFPVLDQDMRDVIATKRAEINLLKERVTKQEGALEVLSQELEDALSKRDKTLKIAIPVATVSAVLLAYGYKNFDILRAFMINVESGPLLALLSGMTMAAGSGYFIYINMKDIKVIKKLIKKTLDGLKYLQVELIEKEAELEELE